MSWFLSFLLALEWLASSGTRFRIDNVAILQFGQKGLRRNLSHSTSQSAESDLTDNVSENDSWNFQRLDEDNEHGAHSNSGSVSVDGGASLPYNAGSKDSTLPVPNRMDNASDDPQAIAAGVFLEANEISQRSQDNHFEALGPRPKGLATLTIPDSGEASSRGGGGSLGGGLSISIPGTPSAAESNVTQVTAEYVTSLRGGVLVMFFDFDGTLTTTPGKRARGVDSKKRDLMQQAPMLKIYLEKFQKAGILIGIISRSTYDTLEVCLRATELTPFFNGPVIGKDKGFWRRTQYDGLSLAKYLNIKEMLPVLSEGLGKSVAVQNTVLIDDDWGELEGAMGEGIQTYPAPAEGGGLSHESFGGIMAGILGKSS